MTAVAEAPKPVATQAGGTATGAQTKAKPEVTVNTKLLELYKKYDATAEKTASYLLEICEFVQRENISRAVLIKTIMEARGVVIETAKSEASKVSSLIKNPRQIEGLRKGELTVRAAVKGAQTARVPTLQSKTKKFEEALKKMIACAKALAQDKKTILRTVDAALTAAEVK